MVKVIGYYIFQSPQTHIDLKSYKHSFSSYCDFNSVVLRLNLKILKSKGIVSTMAMYIQGQIVATKM